MKCALRTHYAPLLIVDMKLLVTGSNGFVAGSIIAQCNPQWELHGIARSVQEWSNSHCIHHQLDMMDKPRLTELISALKPDTVIHTAAMANIDVCEQHPTLAQEVNEGITAHLAQLCNNTGAKLIFCSTDTVFDGIKGNYIETDIPHAVNVYAETKIEAERLVLSASDKNVVSRLSLVLGLPVMGKGNSFLADMMQKLKKGDPVKFPENEIRTPIDVITLGAALIELATSSLTGIIHLGGNTVINRYAMAKQIAARLGYNEELIISTNSNALAGRATRPNNASLNNAKARQLLTTPMRSLNEALELIVNFKTNTNHE